MKAPWIAAAYLPALTAGIALAGYIHTGYGNRPLQQVLTDIDNYRNWYGITRIFLDETPYQCDAIPYYSSIVAAVHQQGGTVILNPGMNPESCWSGVAEVVVNFEGSAATYQTWQPAAWTQAPSSTAFWHVIYGAGLFDGTSLLETAGQRNATWAYITDDVLPNPFDRLPGEQLWKKLTGTTDNSGVINLTPTTPTTTTPTTTTPTTTESPTTTPATTTPTTTTPTTTTPATTEPPTTTLTTTTPNTTVAPSTIVPTTAPATTGTRSGIAPTTAPPSTTNSSATTVAPKAAGPSIPQTTISGSTGSPDTEGDASVAGTETSTTRAPNGGMTTSSIPIPAKLALTTRLGGSGKTQAKSPVPTTTKAKKAAPKTTFIGLKTPSAMSRTVSTSVAKAPVKSVAQKRSAK